MVRTVAGRDRNNLSEDPQKQKSRPLRVVDIHDPLPDDLSFLVKGGYTPTFVMVHDGKEYGRIRGYPGEDFFWGLLSVIIEKLPKSKQTSSLIEANG